MPIYEYHCSDCGHSFEVMQKIKEPPIQECESCGELKAKKTVSQTSFVLKGTGWYATDYGNRSKSDSVSSSAKSTKSNVKTDTSKSTITDKTEKKEAAASKKTESARKAS